MGNEGNVRTLMKWGISGWVMIISFFTYILVDYLFRESYGYSLFNWGSFYEIDEGKFELIINPAVASIAIVLLGIPVGYVIYQVYYFIRWNSPFSDYGLIGSI